MENPENSYHTIDASTMYQYDNHTNIPWNLTQYHTPRSEVDADLQAKKRKWASQKKGISDNKYVTKRGFYMDYELKVGKGIPSASVHGVQKEWNFDKERKKGESKKIDSTLIKYTYLDRIEMEQKNRKAPGICTYSLEKSIKEKDAEVQKIKKKKVSQGQKIFYHMNTSKLSDMVPGAGMHNPHPIQHKLRQNKTDYKFWVGKHQQQKTIFSERDAIKPAPGTHSPMNTTLNTFQNLEKQLAKPSRKNHQGLDARFEYTRENKKKIIEERPSPSSYSTTIQWKGKNISPKKVIWNDLVWKGRSTGVYH